MKPSFPLIHLLAHAPDCLLIENILKQRSRDGNMSTDVKELILKRKDQAKSLEFTKHTLGSLESRVKSALTKLEMQSGVANYILQYLIERLSVD